MIGWGIFYQWNLIIVGLKIVTIFVTCSLLICLWCCVCLSVYLSVGMHKSFSYIRVRIHVSIGLTSCYSSPSWYQHISYSPLFTYWIACFKLEILLCFVSISIEFRFFVFRIFLFKTDTISLFYFYFFSPIFYCYCCSLSVRIVSSFLKL